MRLDRLSIQNFGVYRDATFTFPDPITLVYGDNGAGKSTLKQAIQFALTGRCLGLDANGRGVSALYATGTDALKVQLDTRGLGGEGDTKVRTIQRRARGVDVAFFVDGLAGSSTLQQQALLTELGVTEDILTALCDSRAFLDLGHVDAKAAIMKVLRITAVVDGETLTLEQLDAAYQTAFEDRKAAKRALLLLPPLAKPREEAPDVAALEQQLAGVRDDVTTRIAARAKDDGKRETLEHDHQRAINALSKIEQALEKTGDVSQEIAAAERELETTEPAEGTEPTLQKHRTALVAADGRLPMLTRTLDGIRTHDPEKGCVLDAAIPCKTAPKHFAGQISKLEQEIQTLKADKDAATEALEAARTVATTRERQQKALTALRSRQAGREDLLEQQCGHVATRDRLHDAIAALPAPAAEDATLTELQRRVRKGEETIRDARDLVDAWKTYTAAVTTQGLHAKRVQELEAKVEQLGPKGVRVQALGAAVSMFESVVSAALERFGYTLRIAVDPWAVLINGRASTRLSESERLRVGLALQLAIAEITKVNFAIIDGADILTARGRGMLSELLDAWTADDPSKQVLITASRDIVPVGTIKGVTVYWLQATDGVTTVTRVGARHDEPVHA